MNLPDATTDRLPQCLVAPAHCPPGAEPVAHRGGTVGVLVLHGFTGSPWEIRPVADALIARGMTVAAPVLAGHATSIFALDETTWSDWLTSARQALDWLDARCDRVHFVGLSMGCLLTVLLAQDRPAQRTGGVVLLAPAFAVGVWQRAALQVFSRVGWPDYLGKSDPRLPGGIRPPCYHAMPVRATRQFLELLDVVRSCAVPWALPTLVLHGTRDLTTPCVEACRRARRVLGPAARIETVAGAGHLLPRTRQGPQVVVDVVEFLEGCR